MSRVPPALNWPPQSRTTRTASAGARVAQTCAGSGGKHGAGALSALWLVAGKGSAALKQAKTVLLTGTSDIFRYVKQNFLPP
jgi:hypothetical protein